MDSNKDFKWSEEMVGEFAMYWRDKVAPYSKDYINQAIDNFKDIKSKEVKPDYEILFFTDIYNHGEYFKKGKDGMFTTSISNMPYKERDLIAHNFPIHSIKRLSDNEVFTIGDVLEDRLYKNYPIKEFILNYKGHEVWLSIDTINHYGCALSVAKKVKPQPKVKLFTTEDGVDIFDGYCYFSVSKDFKLNGRNNGTGWYQPSTGEKYFSTKEKLDEYILHNKPIQLSLNQINEVISNGRRNPNYQNIEGYLKDYFKQKINS